MRDYLGPSSRWHDDVSTSFMIFYTASSFNKHTQLAAEKRGWTAKAPDLFVQSLRSVFHKNALHIVCPWRGR